MFAESCSSTAWMYGCMGRLDHLEQRRDANLAAKGGLGDANKGER